MHLCSCSLCTPTCWPLTLSTTPFFFEVATPQDGVSVGAQVLHGLFVAITKRICPTHQSLPSAPHFDIRDGWRQHLQQEVPCSDADVPNRSVRGSACSEQRAAATRTCLLAPGATHSQTHCDAQKLGLRRTSETNTFQHSQTRSTTAVTDSGSEYHIRFWSRRCELELLRAASKRSMSIGQLGRSRHPPSVSRRTCLQFIEKGTKEKQLAVSSEHQLSACACSSARARVMRSTRS